MGDVVIASATMQDVCDAFPDARIDLNALAPWHRLFEGDPRFGEVLCPDLRAGRGRWRAVMRWLSEVRERRYDLVVDLQCNDHSRVLMTLLVLRGPRPRFRAGYHRRFPYNVAPDQPRRGVHVFERSKALLGAMGIPARARRPVLHVSARSRTRAAALVHEHGLAPQRYAVFLPGSQAAGYLKRWGVERYAALARRLHRDGLERVVLLGGPEEIDECEAIAGQCGPWLANLCGHTTAISDIVPLCAGACCVVANDTGPAHVAAATGRPLLVICGPTDPRRVKPIGDDVRTLQADVPCINCYRKHCGHHSCMRLLTPAQVQQAIEEM